MSKREFSKVSPAIWRSKRFRLLPNDRCRLLLFYFMTSAHQTSAGAYQLSEGYACTDLGWSAEDYSAARQPLEELRLIVFDADTEEVYVTGWFNVCPPMNDKHAAGCKSMIRDIESDVVREIVEEEFAEADRVRLQRFRQDPQGRR